MFSIADNARRRQTGASPRRGGSLLSVDIYDSHSKLLGEEEVVEGLGGRLIPKTARGGILKRYGNGTGWKNQKFMMPAMRLCPFMACHGGYTSGTIYAM